MEYITDLGKLTTLLIAELKQHKIVYVEADDNWELQTIAYRDKKTYTSEADLKYLAKHLSSGILRVLQKNKLKTVGDLGISYKPFHLTASDNKYLVEVIFFTLPVEPIKTKVRKV